MVGLVVVHWAIRAFDPWQYGTCGIGVLRRSVRRSPASLDPKWPQAVFVVPLEGGILLSLPQDNILF